ncbi:nitroreductase family deazaflavin-dependent oxidoreductase [Jatrophihabitans sp. YIM 134969]
MPIPRAVARANRVGLNRLTRHVVPHAPGFGLLVHRGRKSGREFRTPVNVFRHGEGWRIALTYGADSDWVKNVLAAGGASVVIRGRTRQLSDPRLVTDDTLAGISGPAKLVLRRIHVNQFVDFRERS